MADKSKIEWTDATWNPIAGCSPVSPGCTHCYAATMARRLESMGKRKYVGTAERRGKVDVFTGTLRFDGGVLEQPLRWRRPRRIFVNSMGDLFHENVPDEWRDQVFTIMALAEQHTFQILTKRAWNMEQYLFRREVGRVIASRAGDFVGDWPASRAPSWLYGQPNEPLGPTLGLPWPLPNVWLGVSVENQEQADKRVPNLLRTPAAVRFLSCEPLLGRVDLSSWAHPFEVSRDEAGLDLGSGAGGSDIDWVIAGGESGPHARPMHPAWVGSLRDQCQVAGVPFFFKQWGEWLPDDGQPIGVDLTAHQCGREAMHLFGRVGKKAAGRLLDGREWNEFPELSAVK